MGHSSRSDLDLMQKTFSNRISCDSKPCKIATNHIYISCIIGTKYCVYETVMVGARWTASVRLPIMLKHKVLTSRAGVCRWRVSHGWSALDSVSPLHPRALADFVGKGLSRRTFTGVVGVCLAPVSKSSQHVDCVKEWVTLLSQTSI